MKISKRIALFFVIVNSALVLFDIWYFIYSHETVFKNFKKPVIYLPPFVYHLSLAVWVITEPILFIGLYWVLTKFKERRWIRIICLLSLIIKIGIALFASSVQLSTRLLNSINFQSFEWLISVSRIFSALALFSLLFVRSRIIRRQLIAFVILVVIAFVIPLIEQPLYDNFGYAWLLVNDGFLLKLPFLMTLVLFVEVFNTTRKPSGNSVEKIDEELRTN